jgi:hypothetical protein
MVISAIAEASNHVSAGRCSCGLSANRRISTIVTDSQIPPPVISDEDPSYSLIIRLPIAMMASTQIHIAGQILRLIILIRHAMKIWIGVEMKTVVMGSNEISLYRCPKQCIGAYRRGALTRRTEYASVDNIDR